MSLSQLIKGVGPFKEERGERRDGKGERGEGRRDPLVWKAIKDLHS